MFNFKAYIDFNSKLNNKQKKALTLGTIPLANPLTY